MLSSWLMDAQSFTAHAFRDSPHGPAVQRILAESLKAVDPSETIKKHVLRDGNSIVVDGRSCDLAEAERVILMSVGKASLKMAYAMEAICGDLISDGLIITKHAAPFAMTDWQVLQAGHPIPDSGSIKAGQEVIQRVKLKEHDIVICLISGGASALLAAPLGNLDLQDLQELTKQLLASGAGINEINTLRRHLDRLKGGGLARLAAPARLISLILSDVVGDPLEAIGSGLTAADPKTKEDALQVLHRYGIRNPKIEKVLQEGYETLKPCDPILDHVQNIIIGSNLQAAQAALGHAAREGFHTHLLRTDLCGEASIAAVEFCRILRDARQKGIPVPAPSCIVAGGETTVTLKHGYGKSRGGRNCELALGTVCEIAGLPDVLLVTLATDGEDGLTDAAGAVVTGGTFERADNLGMDPKLYLDNNDSYSFFAALDDLLMPGSTGTNVNDLAFMFAFK